MRKNPKQIGLAIVGAGRVGLIRGELAARHPEVDWIGIAEMNPERGEIVREKCGADFVTTDFRELLVAPRSQRRRRLHRRASARRSGGLRRRAQAADADREAARHRPRRIGADAGRHREVRRRCGDRLHAALPPPLAGGQGEGAHRRAGRRDDGHLARLHEPPGRHRQLQAQRQPRRSDADGHFRHPCAGHRHVADGSEEAGRGLCALGEQGAGPDLAG